MLPIPRNVFTINSYNNNANSVRSITALPRGKSGYYQYPNNNNTNAYNANNNNNGNNELNNNEFNNNDNSNYYIPLKENTNNNNIINNNNNNNSRRRIRFKNTVKVKPYKLMDNYTNYILQRREREPNNPVIHSILNRMKNSKSKYIRGTKKPSGTRKRSGENKYARTARRGKYPSNVTLPQNVLNRSNKYSMIAHEYAKIVRDLDLNNNDKFVDINKILEIIDTSEYPANIDLGLKSHIYSKYRKALTPNERSIYKRYYANEMSKFSTQPENI
jgi:hypothetical protein